jgi:hypothetical protein
VTTDADEFQRKSLWLAGGAGRSGESTPSTVPVSAAARRRRRPSWLDTRLLLGVLLIIGSVVLGIRTISAADRTVAVWQLNADLAAGTTLTATDVRSVRVRISDGLDRYVSAARSPAGLTITRDLGAGELLPVAALHQSAGGSLVSIPVRLQHVPSTLRVGQRIDVYASVKATDATVRSDRVLAGVTVQQLDTPEHGLLSSTAEVAIVVRVPDQLAAAVVRAIRAADIDVAVVDSAPQSASTAPGAVHGPAASR